MFTFIKKLILPSMITLFFAACGNQGPEVPEDFIIPPAPEEPRIMHIKTYRGESDLKKKSSLDKFIGNNSLFAGKDFVKPYSTIAKNGIIYVTDTAMGVVFVINTNTNSVSFLGDENSGKLKLPVGIALDSNENVYVADSKLQRVFGYDKTGKLFFVLGDNDEFIRPTGVAINKELEILYVVDTKGHTIRAFSLTGDFLFDIGQRGKEDGEFNFPTNIAVDQNSGNIVVVDTQNFRVQIFDQDGEFIHTFGNIGDKPGTFSRPKGVGIDTDGNIYVSDASFDNIQIFDKTGTQLLLYFGNAGYRPGQFQMPAGIYIDENDKIYITENFSGKVQVLQYLSESWKQKNPLVYKDLIESRNVEE